ncbi:MAG: hypothetical protein H0W24_08920 [Lysobacter sp.]|nr:hypothetical protein [Lysobacter sp.]
MSMRCERKVLQVLLCLSTLAVGNIAIAQVYSVPIRWCVIADDANGNGQFDAGEDGAPAFTNPGHVGEVDTDNVLWRRHERPSDNVFIPEAQITFRSGVYNIVEDATLRFPIIPDPDPNPTGDSFWLSGDISASSGDISAEWNTAHNACVDAWREQHGVEDIGVVAINANHYRTFSGDSQPGAASLGGRRMILRDNAYLLPGSPLFGAFESPPDLSAVPDHVDKHFGHETGHALAGLRHTCSNQNIMSNRRLDTNGDNRADNIHLSSSIQEIFSTTDCPDADLSVVDQIALLRDAAKATPGCKIAGTNTDCTVRSDVRADRVKDAPIVFTDLSLVTLSNEDTVARIVHEPMGPLDRKFFEPDSYFDYYTFLDQDNDAGTGGAAEALDVPVRFKGAELATRVRVSMQDRRFRFVPTVWKFDGANFIEVTDRRIRAFGFPVKALTEPGELYLTDQITLEAPLKVFGASEDFRVQAAVVVPDGKRAKVLDLLDDGREKPGRAYRWRSPQFPVCSVTPAHSPRGRQIEVESTGLVPDQPVHLIFGDRHIANGHADAAGAVTISTAVPADARNGQHLITVGTDGTALTADCIAMVRGGRRPGKKRPVPQIPRETTPRVQGTR